VLTIGVEASVRTEHRRLRYEERSKTPFQKINVGEAAQLRCQTASHYLRNTLSMVANLIIMQETNSEFT